MALDLNRPSGEYQKEVTGFFGYEIELKGATLGLSSALGANSDRERCERSISTRLLRDINVEVNIADKVGASLSAVDDSSGEDRLRAFEEYLFLPPPLEGVEYLRFRLTFDERVVGTVCAILYRDCLFITAPDKKCDGCLLSSLLDYAGETLECEAVIVCVKKNQENRALVMRPYMFMGFETLYPRHHIVDGLNSGFVYMAYTLD